MPTLQSEETTDFSRGMYDDVAATAYPRQAVNLIVNGRIQPDGTLQRRWGMKRKHPSSLNTGVGYGATWFRKANGDEQLLAFVGNKAFKSDGLDSNTWTEIATGLRQDYWDFATMRIGSTTYLFAANGSSTIYRWDGTTWDTLPDAPAGVRYLAVFNSRLWGTGHQGVIVSGTRVADPTDWTSAFSVQVQTMTHDGNSPTGLFQLGSHLLVFDRQSTSYIDGYGEQTLIVATGATGFSRSVGCVGFRTIVPVGDNALCWMSERGVEYYSPGAGIQLLSRGVQKFMETINHLNIRDNPGQPSATYDPVRQEYHLALSTSGLRNDRVLVLNLLHRGRESMGAASIDRFASADAGDTFFSVGADGYLTTDPGTWEARSGFQGYLDFVTDGSSGDPIGVDADGYLENSTNDAVPSTLFVGPEASSASAGNVGVAVHSLGYDGFVRIHHDVDLDDVDSSGGGGTTVLMNIVSRPFLLGSPRRRKRVRAVHLSIISEEPTGIHVSLRARGGSSAPRVVSIPATSFNQPQRRRVMMSAVGDVSQVETVCGCRLRVAMIGVSAEVMREPV